MLILAAAPNPTENMLPPSTQSGTDNMTATPQILNVNRGASGSTTLTVNFTPTENLHAITTTMNLPAGVSGAATVAFLIDTESYQLNVSAAATPGTYVIELDTVFSTYAGGGGGTFVTGTAKTYLQLNVNDNPILTPISATASAGGYTLTIEDSAPYIPPGTVYPVTLDYEAPTGQNNAPSFTITGLPTGVTAAFTTAANATSATMTLTVTSGATPGQYTYLLNGFIGTGELSLYGVINIGPAWPPPQTVTQPSWGTISTDSYAYVVTQGDMATCNVTSNLTDGTPAPPQLFILQPDETYPVTTSQQPPNFWFDCGTNHGGSLLNTAAAPSGAVSQCTFNTTLTTPPGLYEFTVGDNPDAPTCTFTVYLQIVDAGGEAAVSTGTLLSGLLKPPAAGGTPVTSGIVATRHQGTQVLRSYTIGVNNNSPAQTLARQKHMSITGAQALQAEEITEAWALAAGSYPGHDYAILEWIDGVEGMGLLIEMTPAQFQYMCLQTQMSYGTPQILAPSTSTLQVTLNGAQPSITWDTKTFGPGTATPASPQPYILQPYWAASGDSGAHYVVSVTVANLPTGFTATWQNQPGPTYTFIGSDPYNPQTWLSLRCDRTTPPGNYTFDLQIDDGGTIHTLPVNITVANGQRYSAPPPLQPYLTYGAQTQSYGTTAVKIGQYINNPSNCSAMLLQISGTTTTAPAPSIDPTITNLPSGFTIQPWSTYTSTELSEPTNFYVKEYNFFLFCDPTVSAGAYTATITFYANGSMQTLTLNITVGPAPVDGVMPVTFFPAFKSVAAKIVYDRDLNVVGLDAYAIRDVVTKPYGSFPQADTTFWGLNVQATASNATSKSAKSGGGFLAIGYYPTSYTPAQLLADWQVIYGALPPKGKIYFRFRDAEPISGVVSPSIVVGRSYEKGTLKGILRFKYPAYAYVQNSAWAGPIFGWAPLTIYPPLPTGYNQPAIQIAAGTAQTFEVGVLGISAPGGNDWTTGEPYSGSVTWSAQALTSAADLGSLPIGIYGALPTGVTITFSPNPVTVAEGDITPHLALMTVTVPAGVPETECAIQIEGTDGKSSVLATWIMWLGTTAAAQTPTTFISLTPTDNIVTLATGQQQTTTLQLTNFTASPITFTLTVNGEVVEASIGTVAMYAQFENDPEGFDNLTLSASSITVPGGTVTAPGTGTFTVTATGA